MSERLERTFQVLAERGLDLCEHFLMCTAGHRIPLAPGAFLAHTRALSEGDARGEFSLDEYAGALERLLSRGWLVVLEPPDIDREIERRAQAALPEVSDDGYAAGDVDFSLAGYVAHREVIGVLFGEPHLAESDTGFNHDEASRRFDVCSPRADLCAVAMNRIEEDGSSYTGTPSATFVERIDPVAIGPWRPNRFVLLPAGFHGVLRYEPGTP